MTLEQCTREEFIYIINSMAARNYGDQKQSVIQDFILDVEFKRTLKILAEADNWQKIAADCRRKYCEFIAKYKGKPANEVPLEKAIELLKDAQRADEKWEQCMRKVDRK